MAIGYNSYEITLKESLRPAITYSINDLKDPSKRKSDYSKTITLPSSKELDKLFNSIFEINVETLTFNPNKKTEITYLADEQVQLEGYLKLDEVVINDRNKVEYRVSIFGKVGDLFNNIGENELTDITGLDIYNHERSRTNIVNSWDTSIIENGSPVSFAYGKGYTYPLIDYGFDSDLQKYNLMHIMPSIYAKEYVDGIFTDAGKTYTSNFLNSAFFKRLIIPFNGTEIQKTATQLDADLFRADGATATLSTLGVFQTIVFPNEILDAGGTYDNATGVYTVGDAGFYDFTSICDFKVQYTPSGNVVDVYINRPIFVKLAVFVNGVQQPESRMYIGDTTVAIAPAATYDTGYLVAYPSDAHGTGIGSNIGGVMTYVDLKNTNPASNLPINLNNIALSAGDTVEIKAAYFQAPQQRFADINLFTDNAGSFFGGTVSVSIGTGKFLNNVVNNAVLQDGEIDIYSVIPENIKQKDFLSSIFNLFGLEIEPDKTDPNNYIIEPFDTFYTSNAVDWQHKIDNNSELVYEPMGLLEASEYLYKYKDDKDYYNESYKSEFEETYGQRSGLIDNDFVKKITTTEVIFSPTPSVGQNYIDIVVPTIIKNDINNYNTTAHNIRILYYGGLKTTSTAWEMPDTIGNSVSYTSYPYAGHFDDPYNPTLDINFGLSKKLYYDNTYDDINLTNNNLFNTYHLGRLQQIANRDSKLVSGMFYLKPKDIYELSFRNLFFFKNSYFRLYKIENYDPNKRLTKCYFLKVINVNPFTTTSIWVNGGKDVVGSSFSDGVQTEEAYPTIKYEAPKNDNKSKVNSGVIAGRDNYVDYSSKNVNISGDNNTVTSYLKDVTLINSNSNTVNGSNVTLINSDNLTIDEDNVTYVNGVKVSTSNINAPTEVSEISASQDVEVDVKAYIVDTSGGNVKVQFTPTLITYTEGQVWHFKKDSAANDLIIEVKLGTIDNVLNVTVTTLNTNVSVIYAGGTKFYII